MGFALPYLSMSRKGVFELFEQPTWCPRFVAMAPTRELAMQISEVCDELAKALTGKDGACDYPVQCVYGGVSKAEQRKQIEKVGVDMLIATPGRLADLCNDEVLDLSHTQYLV